MSLINKFISILLVILATSCLSNTDFEDLKQFPEVEYTCTNGIYSGEKSQLKEGDEIIIYGGTNNFLKKHFDCDTCNVEITEIFFSKPTGTIAFVNIKNDKNKTVTYSLSLYYWDNNRGYNVSTLEAWKSKMTEKEQKLLQEDFTTSVESYIIDNNIYFKKLIKYH